MHQHGALPHAIAVFGQSAWEPVWTALHGNERPAWVREYLSLSSDDPAYHNLNRILVDDGGGGSVRPMFLMRLSHPAPMNRRWVADALVATDAYRKVVSGSESEYDAD